MRKSYRNICYLFFLLTIISIAYELYTICKFRFDLNRDNLGIDKNSYTYLLASQNKNKFIASQKNATTNRILNVTIDLIKTVFLIFISAIFLDRGLQKRGIRAADSNITLIKNGFRDLKKTEINFMSMLGGMFMVNKMFLSLLSRNEISVMYIGKAIVVIIFSYLILLPLSLFGIFILLKAFKKKLLVACYAAIIIKLLPEVLINDKVDSLKMEKVDIKEFPQDIQKLIRIHELENYVYKEIRPSDEKNAALIGYGKGKRLEIYGDFDTFKKDELYAVLLHEIGHAKENTLLRKTIVYISLILTEMIIILYLYGKVGETFSNETISFFTAFLVLFLVYRMLMKQWLFSLYKFVSQLSEYNSDMVSKEYGYGKDLAKTLFKIVLESDDYLMPTRLYNFLRSGHPSLLDRINYLRE